MRKHSVYTLASRLHPKTKINQCRALLTITGSSSACRFFVAWRIRASTVTVHERYHRTAGSTNPADTHGQRSCQFVADNTAPHRQSALSVKTDASPAAGQDKAHYMHYLSTRLPYHLLPITPSFRD